MPLKPLREVVRAPFLHGVLLEKKGRFVAMDYYAAFLVSNEWIMHVGAVKDRLAYQLRLDSTNSHPGRGAL